LWVDINGDLGFRNGGSSPPDEEFFDSLGNEDGLD
jgi:hypothetical protein